MDIGIGITSNRTNTKHSFCSTQTEVTMQSVAKKKRSFISVPKEYAENATVHGMSYIFSAATAVEKFVW